jgi:hypothetical protein
VKSHFTASLNMFSVVLLWKRVRSQLVRITEVLLHFAQTDVNESSSTFEHKLMQTFMHCVRYSYTILTKYGTCKYILAKLICTKFHEN